VPGDTAEWAGDWEYHALASISEDRGSSVSAEWMYVG
jgi:hypothetical protein